MPKYLEEHLRRLKDNMMDTSVELGKIVMAMAGLIFYGIGMIAEIMFVVPLTIGCAIKRLTKKQESTELVEMEDEG